MAATTTQPELFDVGERSPAPAPVGRFAGNRRSSATPAPIGSGPVGETCRSCLHYTRARIMSGSVFLKCGLMKSYWTHGKATDIKASYAACEKWQPRPSP